MNIYWESFKTFFKIGIFTLGGGYAMIPLIEEEVVNKHRWVEKEEMLDLIAIAQSCPGVFAINIAIFIGYKLRQERGTETGAWCHCHSIRHCPTLVPDHPRHCHLLQAV